MKYEVELSRSTIDDIEDILAYLAELSNVYVKVFLEELLGYISYLEDAPLLFAKIRIDYRRLFLKRFSYHVIFLVNESDKKVSVIAILHENRLPRIWTPQ